MTRAKLLVLVVAGLILFPAGSRVAAQPKGGEPTFTGGGPGPGRPLFLEHLYRPELVMRHQGALGLTPEQRAGIASAMKAAQERLGPLQWDLDAKAEAVSELVKGDKVDVDKALAAASQTIEIEGQIKKEHLKLLLEIKNQLTPAQIAKLRELRPERGGPGRPGGPGMRSHRLHPPPPGEDGGPPHGEGDGPPPEP